MRVQPLWESRFRNPIPYQSDVLRVIWTENMIIPLQAAHGEQLQNLGYLIRGQLAPSINHPLAISC